MNTNQNFEVKYTLRLYEPALISELANQYEKSLNNFKNKNEFFTHIIELGLQANRKNLKTDTKKKPAAEPEDDDMYMLLMEIYKYTSKQFRKMYIDHNVLQGLLCSMYHLLLALNNDERLFEEKVEDGFYDDLPPRFVEMIEDLARAYGLD